MQVVAGCGQALEAGGEVHWSPMRLRQDGETLSTGVTHLSLPPQIQWRDLHQITWLGTLLPVALPVSQKMKSIVCLLLGR